MRRILLVVPVALALAGCGGGSAKPKQPATVSSPAARHTLRVDIRGQDRRPRVGGRWHYEVRVTDAATGRPVACRIHLQFTFGGAPVGQVGTHLVEGGVWQETFGVPGNPTFPAAARGHPLVLQAIATAKGYRRAQAGWPLTVR